MAIPQEITDLIIRFENQSAAFLHKDYNETQLRNEFINPFFRALGWDPENKQSGENRDWEVKVEESIRIKGTKKRMDYSFKRGNKILFVVETKKPYVPIKDNAEAAFQLRVYGWNADALLCILTNFHEFAVYDCTSPPNSRDNASYALKEFFTFKDLPEKWDWINTIFGKASAYAEIERYIESTRGKKKTISVDDAILSDIEQWRDNLARNIALRNTKTLTDKELNSVVQQTIDRILFLRICEDRGIEEENTLLHLTESDHIYDQLLKIYRSADIKYNSGLFHFREESGWNEAPDTLSSSVILDDKVLKEIIKDLYEPRSIYRWDIISPAILGQVYEQFLGKVIRLTEGGKAKIEFKPEVKKAGGVFYTPEFIVDYIVKNTVGELIKGKTPREVAKLRILDPACGSGSFLIGAYQYLIDWHLSWYKENLVPVYLKKGSHTDPEISALLPEPIPKKKIRGALDADKFPIYRSRSNATLSGDSNNWKLKTTEKKRILLNNIYGVDIDKQAVEVTKLSLLLKVLEDENSQNITTQLKLFEEQALPHLEQNIKCGNSLVGWDIQTPEMPNDELNRIKPFNWEREYAEVMGAGGFDAVIGNPPYVRQETLKEQKKYFETHYAVYQGTADLYAYFIERGISLLRPKGLFSFIVANKWLRTNFGRQLRNFLLTKQIEEIIDFGDLPVFKTATTYPCIIRVSNEKPVREFCASKVEALDFPSLDEYVMANWHSIDPSTLTDNGWTLGDKGTEKFLKKLQSVGISLEDYTNGKVYRGIITGLNEAFVIDNKVKTQIINEDPKYSELIKPFLIGKDVKRYQTLKSDTSLILMPKGWTNIHSGNAKNKWKWLKENYPTIANHLEPFSELAEKRFDKGDYWWELRACDYYNDFEKLKIIYPNICRRPEFTFDEAKYYSNQKCFIIPRDDKYLLGILNSSLTFFLFDLLLPKLRGEYFEPNWVIFKKFPIRTINLSDPTDKARHDHMILLVTQMLDLNKRLQDSRLDQDKTQFKRQIEATDEAIDKLVYELYGLTGEEIKIVEGK